LPPETIFQALQGFGAGGAAVFFWLWREERKERIAAQETIKKTLKNTPKLAEELGDLVDEIREMNGKQPKTRKTLYQAGDSAEE